jgi:very-short-patch-repair endonuclease
MFGLSSPPFLRRGWGRMKSEDRIHNIESLKSRRKKLRQNATPQECILWAQLRGKNLGFKFYRQHSIGPYIADFYCAAKKIVIELDGSQHVHNKIYDSERTEYFQNLNIKVLRFWNNEINCFLEGVLLKITQELASSPSPSSNFPRFKFCRSFVQEFLNFFWC